MMPRKYLLHKICANCGKTFLTKHLHQRTCCISCGITLQKKEESEKSNVKIAWACGGGVQSSAIAALIYTSKLPKPDYAWIVDSGWEKTSTMNYVNDVLIPKLFEVGVTLHVIKTTDYTDNSVFGKAGYVRLPLFLKKNNTISKLKVGCSGIWKKQVAMKWLREQGVHRCITWIGISLDEKRRVKRNNVKWNENKYPLVEMGIRREDSIDLIARLGWPKPEHTACFICPNQTDYQWQILKEQYSEDWQKAVETEQMIRKYDSNMYLHRECKPLDEIHFNA
jgi:ribosomal protein S27AE